MTSGAARLAGLSRVSTTTLYQCQGLYLVGLRQVPVELQGTVEIDESYFGPRQVRGKRQDDCFRPVQARRASIRGNRAELRLNHLADHYSRLSRPGSHRANRRLARLRRTGRRELRQAFSRATLVD